MTAALGTGTSIRALGSLLRTGVPPRSCLEEWHRHASAEMRPDLLALSRRLRMGDEVVTALRTVPGGAALARVFELHRRAGGSLPVMVDSVADALGRRASVAQRARAATSGSRLSARLVAGLPLAFVPLMPRAGALPRGAAGAGLLFAGVGLAALGLWWIGKLVPSYSESGAAAAALADDIAALLSGGAALIAALDAVACSPPAGIEPVFAAARDDVRSGIGWDAALASAEHPGLAAIGEVLGRTRRCGIAPAAALRELARRLDEEARTEFDRALQRAPVLMVVPLTVCVLPAFAILAFGPFLLGAVSS